MDNPSRTVDYNVLEAAEQTDAKKNEMKETLAGPPGLGTIN